MRVGEPVTTDPQQKKPPQLGRFKLLQRIGKGSMAQVWRAKDVNLKRLVALKIMPAEAAEESKKEIAEQFMREARSAANLDHPGIVQVYEVGQDKGWLFIAMELLEGGDLGQMIAASTAPLDVPRACLIIAEAAEALAFAHQNGVIHRDIKPSNLMLTRSGRCKLTDFGLARISDPSDSFALSTEAVGTPLYLAPEIALGKAASPLSDIYSLGATLYHVLAGAPPFRAKTQKELLKLHVHSPVPNIQEQRPDVPDGLVCAMVRALAKSPGDRFPTAEMFARSIRPFTIAVGSGSGSGAGLHWADSGADGSTDHPLGALSQAVNRSSPGARSSRSVIRPKRSSGKMTAIVAIVLIALLGGAAWAIKKMMGGGAGAPTASAANAPSDPAPDAPSGLAKNETLKAGLSRVIPPATPPSVAAAPVPSPPAPVETAAPTDPVVEPSAPPVTAAPVTATPVTVTPVTVVEKPKLGGVLAATDRAEMMRIINTDNTGRYTIQGQIASAELSPKAKVIRLKFKGATGHDDVIIAYFPALFAEIDKAFGGKDGSGLIGKNVHVTGTLELYKSQPEMVVKKADQIVVDP